MRWDQSVKAALAAAATVIIAALPAVMADFKVTPAEVWTLASAAGGVFFAYLKDHPLT